MVDKVRIFERIIGTGIVSDDVTVDGAKCVAQRHSRISCRRCVEICPVRALSLERRELSIDQSACTHCGACVTVCPTQALSSGWLPWDRLLARCVAALGSGETLVLACSELAEERPEGSGTAIVPCLERVDEALLTALATAGARRIWLAHADCAACEVGCMGAVWSLTAEYAEAMLTAAGLDGVVRDCEGFPPAAAPMRALGDGSAEAGAAAEAVDSESAVVVAAGEGGLSRREVFTGFGDSAKRVFGEVLDEVLGQSRFRDYAAALGLTEEASPLAQASRGQVCAWALEALGRQAGPGFAEQVLETRIFAEPRIDDALCVNCFLCVAYCRSGAIEKAMDGPRVLGFRLKPWLCTQCGACADICRVNAISLDPQVSLGSLLAQEPIEKLYD